MNISSGSCREFTGVQPLRKRVVYVCLLIGALLQSFHATAQSTQPVTLHYVPRPPFMMASGDGLEGLTGSPAYLAFQNARVPFVLSDTPIARQFHVLQTNSGQDCMIGIFKNPERERYAKFTKPIYKDSSRIILTSAANAPRFSAYDSIVDLFNDKRMTLLVKAGYSYGIVTDALIERYQPKVMKTYDENVMMLKSIKLDMADYMLMPAEEAPGAIAAADFKESDFRQIKFKAMPEGEDRHIMCSKSVPDEVIARLNAAIKFKK
jgi:polar amino acid transport system substrate-binding protein